MTGRMTSPGPERTSLVAPEGSRQAGRSRPKDLRHVDAARDRQVGAAGLAAREFDRLARGQDVAGPGLEPSPARPLQSTEVRAGESDGHRLDHAIPSARHRQLQGGIVRLVADEEVRDREARPIARPRDRHAQVAEPRPAAILDGGQQPGLEDLEHVQAGGPMGTKRTRMPGASSAGGSRCGSHNTLSVRPRSRHPPGEGSG